MRPTVDPDLSVHFANPNDSVYSRCLYPRHPNSRAITMSIAPDPHPVYQLSLAGHLTQASTADSRYAYQSIGPAPGSFIRDLATKSGSVITGSLPTKAGLASVLSGLALDGNDETTIGRLRQWALEVTRDSPTESGELTVSIGR
jgi:hypothetical protein